MKLKIQGAEILDAIVYYLKENRTALGMELYEDNLVDTSSLYLEREGLETEEIMIGDLVVELELKES